MGSFRRRHGGPRWRKRKRKQPVGSDIGASRPEGEATSHPAPHVGRPQGGRKVGTTRVTAPAETGAAGGAPYGPCGAPIRKPRVPPVPAFSADPTARSTLSRDLFSAAEATVGGPRTSIPPPNAGAALPLAKSLWLWPPTRTLLSAATAARTACPAPPPQPSCCLRWHRSQ